jgi:hypothetical protein
MSVVGSDWEALKRFNIAELYTNQPPSNLTAASNGAKPQSVTAGEAAVLRLLSLPETWNRKMPSRIYFFDDLKIMRAN